MSNNPNQCCTRGQPPTNSKNQKNNQQREKKNVKPNQNGVHRSVLRLFYSKTWSYNNGTIKIQSETSRQSGNKKPEQDWSTHAPLRAAQTGLFAAVSSARDPHALLLRPPDSGVL
ncbi:hypothetical protein RND71_009512 [Anisodus tanguticus]|uniref:Uncharacterized protein n=1 Tax=Anisodus tanguticus TaxID=243964 RepID=A0AAE1SIF7_9SOLA|nr:hypothetical protein RND71_009512 [Anisodus tanguticus]